MISDFGHSSVRFVRFSRGLDRIHTIRASRAHAHARAPMNSMYPKKPNGKRKPQASTPEPPPPQARAAAHPGATLGRPRQGRVRARSRLAKGERDHRVHRRRDHAGRRRSAVIRTIPDDPNHTFFFHIDDKHVIDGSTAATRRSGSTTPAIRTARPTRTRSGRVFIKALRDIEPGEELNYDYGLDASKASQTQEGEEAVRVPLRQPEVPRHHAGARRRSEHGRAAGGRVEVERVAETRLDQRRPALAWALQHAADVALAPRRAGGRAANRRPRPPRAAPGRRRRAPRSRFSLAWPLAAGSTSPGSRWPVGVALAEALDPRPAEPLRDRPEVAQRPLARRLRRAGTKARRRC